MTRKRVLPCLLLAVLLAMLLSYVLAHLEWRDTPYRTEPERAALRNPLHAGLLLLRRLDIQARFSTTTEGLAELSPDETLLLSGTGYFAQPAARDALLDWVERGGHLLLAIESADPHSELLQALGITLRGHLGQRLPRFVIQPTTDKRELKVEGRTLRVATQGAALFEVEPEPSRDGQWQTSIKVVSEGDDEENQRFVAFDDLRVSRQKALAESDEVEELALYARVTRGKGHVTVGSFAPFTNASITQNDHAALFVRLLTLPEGPRPVLMLVAPPYPKLPVWLWAHAAEAILLALILFVALLWHFVPRFGPRLAEAPPARPGLGEHLAACARFLLDQQAQDALLAPLREEVLRLLEHALHRHPDMPDTRALARLLARMPAAEIELALSAHPANRQDFLRRARCLARLREACLRLSPTSSPGVRR